MHPPTRDRGGFTGYPHRKEPSWAVTGWSVLAAVAIIAVAATVYVHLMPS